MNVLTQPRCDGRKAGDVDAVLGGFGDQRERVGPLAHTGQSPKQRRAGSTAAKASTSARDNVAAVIGMWW